MAPEEREKVLSELIVGKRPDFSRRVLFLDFDGPINLGGHYEPPEGETRHIEHAWRGIPKTGDWADSLISTIHLSYYAEVADLFRDMNCLWISTWKDLTQSKLNPLLGYDFGYVDWRYRGTSDWGGHGKSSGVAKIVKATGCEWLVVDDELDGFQEVIEHESGKAGEIVIPDMDLGISEEEMSLIRSLMRDGSVTARPPAKLEL